MAVVNGSIGDDAWWSRQWNRLLDELGVSPEARASRVVGAARVQRLEVLGGKVVARVQDKELGECHVELMLRQLSDAQWQAATDALAEQALFAAQLLAGDLQPEIQRIFESSGPGLLPAGVDELSYSCSCCRAAQASTCRPIVAVHLAVGEMLLETPGLLFRLRGRERQEMLNDLRAVRNRAAAASLQLSGQERPVIAEQPTVYRAAPLTDGADEISISELADSFWGSSKTLSEFHHHIAPPDIELAILRRLGPLPYSGAGVDAYELLSMIYTNVTEAALAMAYASDPDTDDDSAEE